MLHTGRRGPGRARRQVWAEAMACTLIDANTAAANARAAGQTKLDPAAGAEIRNTTGVRRAAKGIADNRDRRTQAHPRVALARQCVSPAPPQRRGLRPATMSR